MLTCVCTLGCSMLSAHDYSMKKCVRAIYTYTSQVRVKTFCQKVGMTTPKVQERNAVYAGKTSYGMRNKKQHEGKGDGWACNAQS